MRRKESRKGAETAGFCLQVMCTGSVISEVPGTDSDRIGYDWKFTKVIKVMSNVTGLGTS